MENLDYKNYFLKERLDVLLDVDINVYGEIHNKQEKSLYETVNPDNKIPFAPELDDLIRLHYLTRSRKVTTILEFGVGKSTMIFADALKKNLEDYGPYVKLNLRRANPFEVHSIDNYLNWVDECKNNFPKELQSYVNFYISDVEMTTFNGRACTLYKKLPNICPDLIYLDGPDHMSALNDVHGISTASADRLPMSADLLLIEPFLLPGTLIIIDGRTANARFLKNNFQRNWEYHHYVDEDIHTFELIEYPLGKINEKQIKFCLENSADKYLRQKS
jgi:hypothetical protein